MPGAEDRVDRLEPHDPAGELGTGPYELVTMHAETGVTARLLPFTVDGLTWARSMFSGGLQPVARRD